MDGQKIVYRGGEGRIEEKKSRFIATVVPVKSEEEALEFIAKMKKKYWGERFRQEKQLPRKGRERCFPRTSRKSAAKGKRR